MAGQGGGSTLESWHVCADSLTHPWMHAMRGQLLVKSYGISHLSLGKESLNRRQECCWLLLGSTHKDRAGDI